MRLSRLKYMMNKIQEFIVTDAMNLMFNFLEMLFNMFFFAHWLACIFHLVGSKEVEAGNPSWIVEHGLIDVSLFERYINSLYWAFTTMTTVGYGDIKPVSSNERMLVMMCMIIGAANFSHILNHIGIRLSSYNKKS